MVKRFLRDSVVYSLSTFISRGISFFLIPIYTRVFSPEDYGIIDIMAIFASIIHLTVALEISQSVARFFADAGSLTEKKSYASTALWFTAFSYLLFYIFVLVFAQPASFLILGMENANGLFLVGSFSIVCSGLFNFLNNQLRWQLQSLHNMISSLIMTIVSIFVTLTIVVGVNQGIIGVFWGQITGALVGSVIAFTFSRKSFAFIFDWKKWKEMVAFSLPLVPSGIGVFIAMYIDRIAIRHLMTLADVGIYGVGYRLASVVSLLMVGVQGALVPLIYQSYKNPNTPRQIAKVFRYFTFLALVLFIGMSFFSKEMLILLTTPDYYQAQIVISFLVASALFAGMYIFAPGLAIMKKTRVIALLAISSAILNSVLNFLLIPYFGIRGAAFATLISMVFKFVLYLRIANRYYQIPYEWKRIFLATAAVISAFLATSLFIMSARYDFLVRVVFFLISIGVIFIILIDKKEIITVIHLVRSRCEKLISGKAQRKVI